MSNTTIPAVATTASVVIRPDAVYVELRDHLGRVIAYLPASEGEVRDLHASLTAAMRQTDSALDDAATEAMVAAADDALAADTYAATDDEAVHAWLAAHPLDA